MKKAFVGQLVPCVANWPVVRHKVIKRAPTGSDTHRSSTPVSATDSRNRLLTGGQQRWRGRVGNEFTVEMDPPVLLSFQTV